MHRQRSDLCMPSVLLTNGTNAWKLPQPQIGDRFDAVAYTFKNKKGDMLARLEL